MGEVEEEGERGRRGRGQQGQPLSVWVVVFEVGRDREAVEEVVDQWRHLLARGQKWNEIFERAGHSDRLAFRNTFLLLILCLLTLPL
jgi:hypothetical protein